MTGNRQYGFVKVELCHLTAHNEHRTDLVNEGRVADAVHFDLTKPVTWSPTVSLKQIW